MKLGGVALDTTNLKTDSCKLNAAHTTGEMSSIPSQANDIHFTQSIVKLCQNERDIIDDKLSTDIFKPDRHGSDYNKKQDIYVENPFNIHHDAVNGNSSNALDSNEFVELNNKSATSTQAAGKVSRFASSDDEMSFARNEPLEYLESALTKHFESGHSDGMSSVSDTTAEMLLNMNDLDSILETPQITETLSRPETFPIPNSGPFVGPQDEILSREPAVRETAVDIECVVITGPETFRRSTESFVSPKDATPENGESNYSPLTLSEDSNELVAGEINTLIDRLESSDEASVVEIDGNHVPDIALGESENLCDPKESFANLDVTPSVDRDCSIQPDDSVSLRSELIASDTSTGVVNGTEIESKTISDNVNEPVSNCDVPLDVSLNEDFDFKFCPHIEQDEAADSSAVSFVNDNFTDNAHEEDMDGINCELEVNLLTPIILRDRSTPVDEHDLVEFVDEKNDGVAMEVESPEVAAKLGKPLDDLKLLQIRDVIPNSNDGQSKTCDAERDELCGAIAITSNVDGVDAEELNKPCESLANLDFTRTVDNTELSSFQWLNDTGMEVCEAGLSSESLSIILDGPIRTKSVSATTESDISLAFDQVTTEPNILLASDHATTESDISLASDQVTLIQSDLLSVESNLQKYPIIHTDAFPTDVIIDNYNLIYETETICDDTIMQPKAACETATVSYQSECTDQSDGEGISSAIIADVSVIDNSLGIEIGVSETSLCLMIPQNTLLAFEGDANTNSSLISSVDLSPLPVVTLFISNNEKEVGGTDTDNCPRVGVENSVESGSGVESETDVVSLSNYEECVGGAETDNGIRGGVDNGPYVMLPASLTIVGKDNDNLSLGNCVDDVVEGKESYSKSVVENSDSLTTQSSPVVAAPKTDDDDCCVMIDEDVVGREDASSSKKDKSNIDAPVYTAENCVVFENIHDGDDSETGSSLKFKQNAIELMDVDNAVEIIDDDEDEVEDANRRTSSSIAEVNSHTTIPAACWNDSVQGSGKRSLSDADDSLACFKRSRLEDAEAPVLIELGDRNVLSGTNHNASSVQEDKANSIVIEDTVSTCSSLKINHRAVCTVETRRHVELSSNNAADAKSYLEGAVNGSKFIITTNAVRILNYLLLFFVNYIK